MGGFSSVTGLETVMYADNCSFDGTKRGGVITADGQLFIGNSSSPRLRPGTLTSPGGTVVIGYSAPDITLDVNGGAVGQTITGNSGGALSPTAGNWNILGTATNGIQSAGAGSTLTVRMQSPYADADFSFESQVGGTVRTLTVQNTVDAASSAAVLQAQIAGTSSDYALWRLAVASTGSFAGWINPAGDGYAMAYTDDDDVLPTDMQIFRIDSINVGTGQSRMVKQSNLVVAEEGTGQSTIGINANGAAGVDAFLQMIQLNGTDDVHQHYAGGNASNWHTGTDGSAGSHFYLTNAAVGSWPPTPTSTMMQVFQTGEVLFPNTPCFSATLTTTATNQTGGGGFATLIFDNEIFDQGADYNNGTGVFTAPVTGRYHFSAAVFCGNIGAGHNFGQIKLNTSNRNYSNGNYQMANVRAGSIVTNAAILNLSAYADMDAGDTAFISCAVAGSTVTISFIGGTTENGTYFGGMLVA